MPKGIQKQRGVPVFTEIKEGEEVNERLYGLLLGFALGFLYGMIFIMLLVEMKP